MNTFFTILYTDDYIYSFETLIQIRLIILFTRSCMEGELNFDIQFSMPYLFYIKIVFQCMFHMHFAFFYVCQVCYKHAGNAPFLTTSTTTHSNLSRITKVHRNSNCFHLQSKPCCYHCHYQTKYRNICHYLQLIPSLYRYVSSWMGVANKAWFRFCKTHF